MPLLGQDTDRVLSELLGLTAKELEARHAGGVIEPVKRWRPGAGRYRTGSTEIFIKILPHPPLSSPMSWHCTTAVRSLFGSEWLMKRS